MNSLQRPKTSGGLHFRSRSDDSNLDGSTLKTSPRPTARTPHKEKAAIPIVDTNTSELSPLKQLQRMKENGSFRAPVQSRLVTNGNTSDHGSDKENSTRNKLHVDRTGSGLRNINRTGSGLSMNSDKSETSDIENSPGNLRKLKANILSDIFGKLDGDQSEDDKNMNTISASLDVPSDNKNGSTISPMENSSLSMENSLSLPTSDTNGNLKSEVANVISQEGAGMIESYESFRIEGGSESLAPSLYFNPGAKPVNPAFKRLDSWNNQYDTDRDSANYQSDTMNRTSYISKPENKEVVKPGTLELQRRKSEKCQGEKRKSEKSPETEKRISESSDPVAPARRSRSSASSDSRDRRSSSVKRMMVAPPPPPVPPPGGSPVKSSTPPRGRPAKAQTLPVGTTPAAMIPHSHGTPKTVRFDKGSGSHDGKRNSECIKKPVKPSAPPPPPPSNKTPAGKSTTCDKPIDKSEETAERTPSNCTKHIAPSNSEKVTKRLAPPPPKPVRTSPTRQSSSSPNRNSASPQTSRSSGSTRVSRSSSSSSDKPVPMSTSTESPQRPAEKRCPPPRTSSRPISSSSSNDSHEVRSESGPGRPKEKSPARLAEKPKRPAGPPPRTPSNKPAIPEKPKQLKEAVVITPQSNKRHSGVKPGVTVNINSPVVHVNKPPIKEKPKHLTPEKRVSVVSSSVSSKSSNRSSMASDRDLEKDIDKMSQNKDDGNDIPVKLLITPKVTPISRPKSRTSEMSSFASDRSSFISDRSCDKSHDVSDDLTGEESITPVVTPAAMPVVEVKLVKAASLSPQVTHRHGISKSADDLDDTRHHSLAPFDSPQLNLRESFMGNVSKDDQENIYHSLGDVQTLLKNSMPEENRIYSLPQPQCYGDDTLKAVKKITEKYDTLQRRKMRALSFRENAKYSGSTSQPTSPISPVNESRDFAHDQSHDLSSHDHSESYDLSFDTVDSVFEDESEPTSPTESASVSSGVTAKDISRIDIFYRGQGTEVAVCHSLADLLTGTPSGTGEVAQWEPIKHTGVPVLVFNTGVGKRRRELYLTLAERETGFPMWQDRITYLSNYKVVTPELHTAHISHNLSKVVGLQFYSANAASDFLSKFKEFTKNPADELWKIGQSTKSKKRRLTFYIKRKSSKSANKKEISQPCNFSHITKVDPKDSERVYECLQDYVPPTAPSSGQTAAPSTPKHPVPPVAPSGEESTSYRPRLPTA